MIAQFVEREYIARVLHVEERDPRADASHPLSPLAHFIGPLATGDSLYNNLTYTAERLNRLMASPAFEDKMAQLNLPTTLHKRYLIVGHIYRKFEGENHVDDASFAPHLPSYVLRWPSNADAQLLIDLAGPNARWRVTAK